MLNRKGFLQSEELSKVIVKGMQEKKAEDIVVLDLRFVPNSVADFFVICTGNSDTQVDAISDSVETTVFEADQQKSIAAGADAFVSKVAPPERLLAAIQMIVVQRPGG